MEQEPWLLVPWTVPALAAGIQFWKVATFLILASPGVSTGTNQFRQTIEQIWVRGVKKITTLARCQYFRRQ